MFLTLYYRQRATNSTAMQNRPRRRPGAQAAVFCSSYGTMRIRGFPDGLRSHRPSAPVCLAHSHGMLLWHSIYLLHALKWDNRLVLGKQSVLFEKYLILHLYLILSRLVLLIFRSCKINLCLHPFYVWRSFRNCRFSEFMWGFPLFISYVWAPRYFITQTIKLIKY